MDSSKGKYGAGDSEGGPSNLGTARMGGEEAPAFVEPDDRTTRGKRTKKWGSTPKKWRAKQTQATANFNTGTD